MQRFGSLLRRIIRTRFQGQAQELARRLAIAPQQVSRAQKQPFNIRGCLRLAQVSGENASTVLRAAGHAEIAHLLEALYGPPRAVLSAEQQTLLTAWAAIRKPQVRNGLLLTIQELAARSRSHSPKGGSGGSTPGMPFPPESSTPPNPETIMLPTLVPWQRPVSRRRHVA